VLDGTYPTADRERPTVGARWSAILDRALARESGDRWESARAFADAIHAELEQLGFAEPRRDIAEFFADPDAYAKAHEERIVARLVELGEQARATGDVPAAAAHFNRALAYRPSDPDLLRRVTGLARAVRLRRTLRRAGLVLAGSAAFAGLAFAVGRALRGTAAATAASAEARGARRHDGARLPIGPEPATRAGAVASGSPLATGRRAPKLHFPRPPASASAPTGTRQVKISTPTQGAIVSIDGAVVDIREIHALSVGSHTLEFAPPPDTDCCLKSSKTVIVLEGEGVQTLSGALAFKDATISVSGGPSGTTVTCPLLAPGQHAVPATIKVRMSKTTATGACTLTPPESSGEAPVSKTVSLTAGKTVNLTWP
jgi:serine/threonine-protein kinase